MEKLKDLSVRALEDLLPMPYTEQSCAVLIAYQQTAALQWMRCVEEKQPPSVQQRMLRVACYLSAAVILFKYVVATTDLAPEVLDWVHDYHRDMIKYDRGSMKMKEVEDPRYARAVQFFTPMVIEPLLAVSDREFDRIAHNMYGLVKLLNDNIE